MDYTPEQIDAAARIIGGVSPEYWRSMEEYRREGCRDIARRVLAAANEPTTIKLPATVTITPVRSRYNSDRWNANITVTVEGGEPKDMRSVTVGHETPEGAISAARVRLGLED